MIRIRFHGRGGHGVKTASRIVGTAAFLAGFQCQDCPVYGAERRGAAVASFTRISSEVIRERGVIRRPDLVVIADETLLTDPAAGVLQSVPGGSLVLINTPDVERLEQDYRSAPRLIGLDLTARAQRDLGRASALSAGLAAAAARLTGRLAWEVVEAAVREELAEIGVSRSLMDKNVALARWAYDQLAATPVLPPDIDWEAAGNGEARNGEARNGEGDGEPLVAVTATSSVSGSPSVLNVANTGPRRTGAWRVDRPLIDRDICTRCGLCMAACPDGAITLDEAGYPMIDYDHCKGCLICLERCPLRAIRSQRETQAW